MIRYIENVRRIIDFQSARNGCSVYVDVHSHSFESFYTSWMTERVVRLMESNAESAGVRVL